MCDDIEDEEVLDINMFYKVILIGSASVGKTSLCNALNNKRFYPETPVTVGVDFNIFKLKGELNNPIEKKVNKTKVNYKLQIWDTAGHEKFRAVTRIYYKESQIILLCFDLSNRKSFLELEYWMEQIREHTLYHISICIVGLKNDLYPVVDDDEVMEFMKNHSIDFFHKFSSKNPMVIDKIKNTLLEMIEDYNLTMDKYEEFKKIDNFDLKLKNYINNENKLNKSNKSKSCCN
jgi:small GTP-binding protein